MNINRLCYVLAVLLVAYAGPNLAAEKGSTPSAGQTMVQPATVKPGVLAPHKQLNKNTVPVKVLVPIKLQPVNKKPANIGVPVEANIQINPKIMKQLPSQKAPAKVKLAPAKQPTPKAVVTNRPVTPVQVVPTPTRKKGAEQQFSNSAIGRQNGDVFRDGQQARQIKELMEANEALGISELIQGSKVDPNELGRPGDTQVIGKMPEGYVAPGQGNAELGIVDPGGYGKEGLPTHLGGDGSSGKPDTMVNVVRHPRDAMKGADKGGGSGGILHRFRYTDRPERDADAPARTGILPSSSSPGVTKDMSTGVSTIFSPPDSTTHTEVVGNTIVTTRVQGDRRTVHYLNPDNTSRIYRYQGNAPPTREDYNAQGERVGNDGKGGRGFEKVEDAESGYDGPNCNPFTGQCWEAAPINPTKVNPGDPNLPSQQNGPMLKADTNELLVNPPLEGQGQTPYNPTDTANRIKAGASPGPMPTDPQIGGEGSPPQ